MHPLAALAWLVDFVFPPRTEELIVRGLTAHDMCSRLSPTLIETMRPPVTALASFDDEAVRACVKEAKYHANEKAQRLLGALLAEYLTELGTDTYENVVIVPMPLSTRRRSERGFNQCEIIAHAADAQFPIDIDILIRVRDTEHQTRLSKSDRLKNVRDAFLAPGELDPGVTYLLFDDVVTTGATLNAAARALRSRGARHILPLALAT